MAAIAVRNSVLNPINGPHLSHVYVRAGSADNLTMIIIGLTGAALSAVCIIYGFVAWIKNRKRLVKSQTSTANDSNNTSPSSSSLFHPKARMLEVQERSWASTYLPVIVSSAGQGSQTLAAGSPAPRSNNTQIISEGPTQPVCIPENRILVGPDPSRKFIHAQQQRALGKFAAGSRPVVEDQTRGLQPGASTEQVAPEVLMLQAQMSILRNRVEELQAVTRGGAEERIELRPPAYEAESKTS
jgi:hypothetical protein